MGKKQRNEKKLNQGKYPLNMRVMHWVLALLIISLLIVGKLMTDMPTPDKFFYYKMHKAFGIVALVLVMARIIMRFKSKLPENPLISPVEMVLYHIGLVLLYAFMIVMPLSGFVMSDAGGHPIDFFGIRLPDLIATNKALASVAHTIHVTGWWLFAIIIAIHIFASFKHYFIDKLNLFKRII